MKTSIGLVLGLEFAFFIMPKIAQNTIAAKYHKTNVAFAEDKKAGRFSNETCSFKDSSPSNVGKAVKIKCPTNQVSN